MAAATAYTPPASAAPPSVILRADVADLTSREGTERLLDRMHAAARTVCSQLSPLDQWTRHARERCYYDTLEHALRQVGEPGLIAAQRARARSQIDRGRGLDGAPPVVANTD